MAQKTIRYGIAFDVDRVSLDRIQNQLQKIMQTPTSGMEKGFEKVQQTASEVYQILRQCYNQDLGTVNIEKFNAKLKQPGIGLKELQSLGPNTFNRMGMAMASANVQLNRSNTFINNIVKTFADSAKWSMAYGLINKVSQSVIDAISYVKDLDTSLNDIRIVTGKSEENMRAFAKEANKAAIALGSSTKAYTDASLIYYQQGLGDAEAKERARITTMAANVTGQSASQVSEMLTAIWNGYKVSASEAELYIDKVAKVAAQTGADLEELATGMSKVASAANLMGVDVDELNAQLSTVITVTRQAPESVGTAFKTIYARINAIESGSEDAETTLKQYTQTMLEYGVHVLDMNGKLRDTGDIIAEIGGKWSTLTKEQQLGLTQAMAGQRQYNNLLALFENWDMYNDALYESQNAMGTLQEQQDIYMDSIAAHAAQAKAEFEALYENILDKESINGFYDFTGNIAGTFNKMFSSFGGGLTSLMPLLLTIGSLFSKQIASGAYNLFSTLSKTSPVVENIRNQMALISTGAQGITHASAEVRALAAGYQSQLDILERMQAVRSGLSEAQQKEIVDGATRLGQLEEELALADAVMQKSAQGWGNAGGIKDINSIISQEDIAASYRSRQMGNSPENDALGQKIQLRKQELALTEEAVKIEEQFTNLLGTGNQTLQQQEYALINITNGQKTKLQTAAKTLKIENAEKMTTEDLVAAIKSKIIALKSSKQTTQEELDVLEQISAEMTETAGQFSRQRIEAEGLKGSLDNTLNSASKLSSVVKGTTTILSGVGTVAMSWQTLSTSMDAFKEASEGAISWGDAITQALMSIGMGLPMALGAIKNLNETFGITTGIIDGYNARKMISNQLDQASIPLIGKKITNEQVLQASGMANLVVTDKLGDEQTELALATALKNKENTKALAILKGLNADQLKKLRLDEAQIVNLERMTIEQGKFNASAWANPYLLIGVAIVAAIAAIIAVTYKAVTAESEHEKQLRKINESLENQQKRYDELKQKVDGIKQSFDNYKSVKETLDKCTKGTLAWRDAFEEVQEQARNLIKTYPELTKQGNLWKPDEITGGYILDEEKLQSVLESYDRSLFLSEQSIVNTTLAGQQAALNVNQNELIDSLSGWDNFANSDGVWAGILKGLEYAAAGSLLFIPGAGIPLAAAGVAGLFAADFAGGQVKKVQEELYNNLFAGFEEGKFKTESEIREYAQELVNLGEISEKELNDLIDRYDELVIMQKEQNQAVRNQSIGQVQQIYGADASIEEIEFGINAYQATYAKKMAEIEGRDYITGKSIFKNSGKDNDVYQQLVKDLADATGLAYSEAKETHNTVRHMEGARTFIVNLNGEDIEMSKEDVKQTLATAEAIKALGKSAYEASEVLNQIQAWQTGNDSERALGEAFQSLLVNKDLTGLTASQLELFKSLAGEDKIFSQLELENLGLTEEMLDDFGWKDWATAINAINASLEYDLTEALNNTLLNVDLQNSFNQTEQGWKELTGIEQENFAHQINKIFKEVGTDAAKVFSDLLTQGMVGFEDDLANFDYANASFEDFIELYRQNGITIDETTEGAEKLFSYLKNNATSVLNQTSADFLTLANSAKALKLGETISEEEYKKYGDLAEDYFVKMADGTYMLTKDADLFYDSILNKSDEFRQERKDQIQKEIDEENALLSALGSWAETGIGYYSKGVAQNKYGGTGVKEQRYTMADQLTLLLELVGNKMSAEDKTALEAAIAKGYAGEALGDSDGSISKLVTKYMAVADTLGVVEERQKSQKERLKDEDKAAMQTAKSWDEFNKIAKESQLTAEEIEEQREARIAGILAEQGYTTEAFKEYVDNLMKVNGATEAQRHEYEEFALTNLHLKEGIEELNGSWEKWEEILNQGTSNPEYFTTLETLKTLLGNTFGVDKELIESEFFTPEIIKQIGLAAEGDLPAIQKLKVELAKLKVNELDLDVEGVENEAEIIISILEEVASQDLELGEEASISPTFKTMLEKMITASATAAATMNALLGSVGGALEYTYKNKTDKYFDSREEAEDWLSKNDLLGEVKQAEDSRHYGVYLLDSVKIKGLDKLSLGLGNGDKETKKDKDKYEEYKENIEDLTHDVSRAIKKIDKQLSSLEKKRKGLYGKKLIENLNQQLNLIEEQNEQYEEQKKQIQDVLKTKRELGEIEFGLTFDEATGEIENFTTLYTEKMNLLIEVERRIKEASEANAEALIEEAEKLKAELEALLGFVSDYEANLDEIDEIDSKIEDNLEKKIELQIEKFNMAIEIQLDMAEVKKQWHEFEEEVINRELARDPMKGPLWIAEDRIAQYEELYGPGGPIESLITHIQKVQAEAEKINAGGESSVYGDKLEYALDDLQKYYEELMQYMQDAEELADEVREQYVTLLDNAKIAFDDQINTYEVLQGILEHDIELLKLLHGEESNYNNLIPYYDKQIDNYKNLLDFQRQSVIFWQEQLAFAEEGSEAYIAAKENLIEATENLNSTLMSSLEAAQEKYLNAVNSAFEEFEKKLTNGKGLSYLEKEWEMIKDNADDYLDTVNSTYQLSKLESNYRKAIDETSSLSAQKKLNEAMVAELNILKQKDKLSQYDIDRANLKYQLTLKQIALEESQKNKSMMRLKRDVSGNYSYQYVADSDQTAQLQSEIDDLNNQIYNLDNDAYESTLDDMLSYYGQFKDEMLAAQEIKDPALRAQEQERIMFQFSEKMKNIMTDNQNIRLNLMSYELEEMVTGWDEGIQQMIDMIAGEGGWSEAYQDTAESIESANEELQEDIHILSENAGIDLEQLKDGFDGVYNSVSGLIGQNDALIDAWAGTAEAMQGIIAKLESVEKTYEHVKEAGIKCATEAKNSIISIMESALAAIAQMEAAMADEDTDWARRMAQTYNPDAARGGAEFEAAQDQRQSAWANWEHKNKESFADTTELNNFFLNTVGHIVQQEGATPESSAVLDLVQRVANGEALFTDENIKIATEKDKKWMLEMSTGGYTGEWANGDIDGKLALLHQKELVLNAEDTANILSAVDVVRMLDTNLLSRVAGMLGSLGMTAVSASSSNNQPLEQNVHIDAHFPNVSSAQEIKDAFNQLISQINQKLYSNIK